MSAPAQSNKLIESKSNKSSCVNRRRGKSGVLTDTLRLLELNNVCSENVINQGLARPLKGHTQLFFWNQAIMHPHSAVVTRTDHTARCELFHDTAHHLAGCSDHFGHILPRHFSLCHAQALRIGS